MQAEELLRQGKPEEALSALQERVRSQPADPKHRIFLFQLLCVLGRWDKAMTQLNVAAELDPGALLMAQVCRSALQCEALRAEIFADNRQPLFFGEPPPWAGLIVQAGHLSAAGRHEEAAKLRAQALEDAPAVAGAISGEPFEWIADADTRLGPIFEVMVDGRYFWAPFQNVASIEIEKPEDLRDLIWAPANLVWTNGGSSAGFLFTRYPGSESSPDPAIRLARKTEWTEHPGGAYTGLGQRMFATDAGEYPLLETRSLTMSG